MDHLECEDKNKVELGMTYQKRAGQVGLLSGVLSHCWPTRSQDISYRLSEDKNEYQAGRQGL